MNPGDLDPQWLWLAAAVLLAIAELIAPGVFLIWIAVAAALTGLVTMLFGLPVAFEFILFGLFSIATVYWGRRWYSNNPVESSDPLLNDRAARLRGETVIVVEPIAGGRGRVKVGDGVWDASGPDAPAGARVRVTGARGTCLLVEPLVIPQSPNIG